MLPMQARIRSLAIRRLLEIIYLENKWFWICRFEIGAHSSEEQAHCAINTPFERVFFLCNSIFLIPVGSQSRWKVCFIKSALLPHQPVYCRPPPWVEFSCAEQEAASVLHRLALLQPYNKRNAIISSILPAWCLALMLSGRLIME